MGSSSVVVVLCVFLAVCFGTSDVAVATSLPPFLKGGGRGGGGVRGGSGTGRGSSGNTGHPSIATSGVNGRKADYYSAGGGKPVVLAPPSVFAGRLAGGGTRDQVLGTRRYGSGYPYYSQDPRYDGVAGQPFPFGFWPIYWVGYGHGYEYGVNSTVTSQRPGGHLTYIQLIPNASSGWNTTVVNGVNETYWMIGDLDSLSTLFSILVDPPNNKSSPYGCNVQNLGPYTFPPDPNSNSSDISLPFRFENVIQWYRSSSFALAYQGYNNTYATSPLNQTTGLGWNESVPLPDQQLYSPFLDCINTTITAALPILNAPSPKLSTGAIVGIVIGSVIGVTLILIFLCCLLARKRATGTEKRREKEARKREKSEEIAAKLAKIKAEYTKENEGASKTNTIRFPTQPLKQGGDENVLPARDIPSVPSPYSIESGMTSDMESNVKHTYTTMPEPRKV